MPITYTGTPEVRASLGFIDFNDQTDTMRLTFNPTNINTLALAETAAKGVAATLCEDGGANTTPSGLQLTSVRIDFDFVPVVDASNGAPTFGHQREYIGVVEVLCSDVYTTGPKAGSPRVRKIKFPAPVVTALAADKRYLDTTNAGLLAFVNNWQAGATAASRLCFGLDDLGNPITLLNVAATSIVRAYVQHEESRVTVMQAADKLKIG